MICCSHNNGEQGTTKFQEKYLGFLTCTKGSISWFTETQEPSHTISTDCCSVAVMVSPQTLINGLYTLQCVQLYRPCIGVVLSVYYTRKYTIFHIFTAIL